MGATNNPFFGRIAALRGAPSLACLLQASLRRNSPRSFFRLPHSVRFALHPEFQNI